MTESDNDYQDVMDHLAMLAPDETEAPMPASQALNQVSNQLTAQKRQWIPSFLRSNREMKNNRKSLMAVGAIAVMAVVLMVGFPTVRAAANDFLGLFRVEKFAPISVSPQQVALLEQLNTEGFNPGEMVMTKEPGEPAQVASLEEAAVQTGYDVVTLGGIMGEPEVFVMPDASGYLQVDLAGARAIVEAVGVDPMLLPDSLDGARIDVSTSPGVAQVWADGTNLMQTASPTVNYPADVDPTVLGEAMLRVLGMDADAARQMAQTIDWASTMLLPIPRDLATYQQVVVNGAPGVAITPLDGSSETAVMWQKGGMLYVLSGPTSVEGLLNFNFTRR
jgi:hypothetical protein